MKNKKIIFLIIGIVAVLALVIGLTYAFFQSSEEGSTNVIEVADGLSLELINEDTVSIADTMPMTDDWAIENIESYTFSLSNTGTQAYEYTISMNHEVVELPVNVIRYGIKAESDKNFTIGDLESFTYKGVVDKGTTENLELKLWVDKDTTIDYQGKEYTGHIEVTGEVTEYIPIKEITVDLTSGMVPIKWDGDSWVKADSTNTKGDWYDYKNYKWANMALVNDESLYTTQVNEEIPMDNILAMYVYIPRYRYKLWNAENGSSEEQEIEIIFEEASTPKSNGSTNGTYLTHPAFTFGEDELNGIWVGKFETSDGPKIVPNTTSLKQKNIASFFDVNKNFKNYGLTNTNADSHMMKNVEWGAVAYLYHSKYGKYGNPSYIGVEKEIYINNYRKSVTPYDTLTGCSGGAPAGSLATVDTTCPYTYEVEGSGTGASTTGTIYGIYDMVGGASEYVMGNMVDENGNFYPSGSGFTTPYPDAKYYDSYPRTLSNTDYSKGKLGDATREMLLGNKESSWYSDGALMVSSTGSWFVRGGYAGHSTATGAGIFFFSYLPGDVNPDIASRGIIAIIN